MKMNISDLLDDIYDDDIDLAETDITTPDRILSLVKEQLASKTEKTPADSVQLSRKNRGMVKLARIVLIAAVLALALSVTALAVGGGDFFRSVFGSKGMENIQSGVYVDDVYPAREWADIDEQTAENMLGEYVIYSGRSVSAKGYTLTVEDLFLDENGMGAISYCISNPDGVEIEMVGDYAPGRYTFRYNSELQLNDMWVSAASGADLDRYWVLDASRTTDTELHSVLYFTAMDPLPEGDTLYASFDYTEATGASNELGWPTYEKGWSDSIEISTENRAPTATFLCGELTAHLSAIGIAVDPPAGTAERIQTAMASGEGTEYYWGWFGPGVFEVAGLSIAYADGSIYTVYTAEPFLMNTITIYPTASTQVLYAIFNRFVDVDNVTAIVITGNDGEELTFTPEVET